MNLILQAIQKRRSVRSFDSTYQIPETELMAILDAARHAPTAFNLQNVRFLVVRDTEQRRRIREVAWNQAQITDCSALIVMCADVQAWQKDLAPCWKDASENIRNLFLNTLIPGYYKGHECTQRDEAFRSCGLAAYALMMAAAAHGLQTCPMDGFDFGQVKHIINLPADYELVMFVAIGKQAEEPNPNPGRLPLKSQVFFDKF